MQFQALSHLCTIPLMHRAGQAVSTFWLSLAALSIAYLNQEHFPATSRPNWTNLNGLNSDKGFTRNNQFFTSGTSQKTSEKPMGSYIKDSYKLSLI